MHIRYYQTETIRNKDAVHLKTAILAMLAEYSTQGGVVTHIQGDGAFKCLEPWLATKQIRLTVCDAEKHVPRAERSIRELKEKIRSYRLQMKFKKLPKRFTIEMIKESIKVLSSLPKHNSNLHLVQSPRELVTGIKLVVSKIQMGQYCQGLTGGSNKIDR